MLDVVSLAVSILHVACISGLLTATAAASGEFVSRSAILRSIDGLAKDGRLYLDFCQMSSGQENCQLAIDSHVNQEFWSNECAMSSIEDEPWFEARLETPSFITRVVILGLHRVAERGLDALTHFELTAGAQHCISYNSKESFQSKAFSCDTFAQFIRIQSWHKKAVLALCEMEVYGKRVRVSWATNGNSPLESKTCVASSGSYCEYVMDGLPETCFTTQQQNERTEIFVELVLKAASLVRKVTLLSKSDRQADMAEFEFEVDGRICHKYHGGKFEKYQFECNKYGTRLRLKAFPPDPTQMKIAVCEIQPIGFPPEMHNNTEFYKYIGCYQEKKDNRDMQKMVSISRMTVDRCERICRRRVKPYFSLQHGRQCWCSDRFGIHGRLDDDHCWMSCDGSRKQQGGQCGAKLANSVFEISGLVDAADSRSQTAEQAAGATAASAAEGGSAAASASAAPAAAAAGPEQKKA